MDPRSHTEADVEQLITALDKPSKAQLQAICSLNGLSKTGNKADLIRRITQLIRDVAHKRDNQRYQEVRQSIYAQTAPYGAMAPSYLPLSTPQTPAQSNAQRYIPATYPAPPAYGLANGQRPGPVHAQQHAPSRLVVQDRPKPPITPGFEFKPSPFYEMNRRLGDFKICEVMAQHRNSVTVAVKTADILSCSTDPSLRVMVFCAGGNTGTQDIAFPHQSELKVNGGDIKANLRGLKNKIGSTRPVDITDSLRLRPANYTNTVEFTYALTNKKYYLLVVLCRSSPVHVLINQIQKKIRKETVIADLTKKAHDPDIEATSLNLSLKCPLSYARLSRPCRALSCTHIQCFDATSYLQLQEQGPQWVCPICNNPAPFDQLAVDEYVREILTSTVDSVEQVTIDPYGQWSVPGAKSETRPLQGRANYIDDDDLVISSFHTGSLGGSSYGTATPSRTFGAPVTTPNTGASQSSSAAPRPSAKRPAPEVIDLTLSDDEEDPYPPTKRVNLNQNGFNGAAY